jgi:hypothetical protein
VKADPLPDGIFVVSSEDALHSRSPQVTGAAATQVEGSLILGGGLFGIQTRKEHELGIHGKKERCGRA